MIKRTNLSVFEGHSRNAFIVNPVNIVGVMGKGLALQFKKKFPKYFRTYKLLCDNRRLEMGSVHIDTSDKIISFPTKDHWSNKSEIINIENALKDLKNKAETLGIERIFMPQIGSGLGGLDFDRQVLPLIIKEFKTSDILVVISLYQP